MTDESGCVIDSNLQGIYLTIGENIRRLRGRMSQRDLAKKSGVSRSTINGIENGKSISLESLHLIAKTLNIPMADFFITDKNRGDVSYMHVKLMEKIAESLDIKKESK